MPDQSASSALRTTSVYQRSKSSDILVRSFTKSCCSSVSCFIGAGLGREGVLGRNRVDLGQQHWEQLLLGHGLVKATFLKNHALARPPVTPMSACRASAGPLTTHPITATVIGTL